jgi:methionine-S-sulfoxide reductase
VVDTRHFKFIYYCRVLIQVSFFFDRGPDFEYSSMPGVTEVVVGYTGGDKPWPTYQSILDHTEAVRVTFDPSVISYRQIVKSYFAQNPSVYGASWMRQYRSAIMVHNEEQRVIVDEMVSDVMQQTGREVFMDVEYAVDFYLAEEYHQKWKEKNESSRNKWI